MFIYVGIGVIAVLVVVAWRWLTEVRPPIFGVYTQPSRLHGFKTWLFCQVLENRNRANKVKSDIPGCTTAFEVQSRAEEMDKPQPLSPEHPKAVDAVYFNGSNRDGWYFVAATARRHQGLAQTLLYIMIPGLGMLELPSLPDTSLYSDKQMEYSAGGLEITMVEATKIWSLKFKGSLRLFKEDGSSCEVDVNFDLLWTATTPMFNFDTDLSTRTMAEAIAAEKWSKSFFNKLKQSHQTHWEQVGNITGMINVNSQSYDLNVKGFRDHTYGNFRDWADFHRYAIQYVVLEDGTSFCVGNICVKSTLTRIIIGYVFYPDGFMRSVTWTDLELHKIGEDGQDPDDFSFSFTAGPDLFRVKCHVEHRPIFYMGENWEGRIHERMCTFVVNGKKGSGISEWDYYNPGGKGNIFKR